MNSSLVDILKTLQATHEDFRTEVLFAEIFKATSTSTEDLLVSHNSTFNRSYNKDLVSSSITELKDQKQRLKLNLSRNGIYDRLPEGFFHKDTTPEALNYTKSKQEQKKEEAAARLLFAPIENELFHQRVSIEQKNEALTSDFGSLKDDFLIDLWKIDKQLPKKYALRLVKLLPYMHKIAGDLDLSFKCLEKILQTKITYKKRFKTRTVKMSAPKESILGLNLVLQQEELSIQQPFLEVTIIPKNNKNIQNYISEEDLKKIAHILYRYFIPFEYEISTNMECLRPEGFVLGQKEGTFMGITTRL